MAIRNRKRVSPTDHEISNLKTAEQWVVRSAEILHGIVAAKSPRTALPGAMFMLAVQYQHGISLLCRNGLYAGAFALLRPLTEAMFRGAWLRYAASDQELRGIADGKKFPDRGRIDRDLLKAKPRYALLREYLDRIYDDALHDFSHGGHQQMWSRIQDGIIGEAHQLGNVKNLIHASCTLGYICSVEIATSCDSPAHAQRLQDLFRSLFPKPEDLDRLAEKTVENP